MNKNVLVLAPFVYGGSNKRLIKLIDEKNNERIVEPYLIYDSEQNWKYYFHFYQVGGYCNTGVVNGWKSIEIHKVSKSIITEQLFLPRDEYNPFDKCFRKVFFSIKKQKD